MRRIAKVDANQPAIVAEFRRLGCTVLHMHKLGQGAPDLAVGKLGVNVLVEIKASKKDKLTPDEFDFFRDWKGHVSVVVDAEDVARVVSVIEDEHRLKLAGMAITRDGRE